MDTLTDRADIADVDALELAILPTAEGVVGFAVAGVGAFLSDAVPFGRALRVPTGDALQVRVSPRGALGRPLARGETRVVAVKRRPPHGAALVSLAVLVRVDDYDAPTFDAGREGATNRCVGAGGLHLFTPARFSKHSRAFDEATTSDGYHYLAPVLCAIEDEERKERAITPGMTYARLAAILAGLDVALPNPPLMSSVTYAAYTDRVGALLGAVRDVSPAHRLGFAALPNVAVRLLESMDAEGLLCLLTDERTRDTLPDMLVLPMGLKLTVVAACRIATRAREYAGVVPTARDARINAELMTAFASHFPPVEPRERTYAIDVVLSLTLQSLDERAARRGEEASSVPATAYFASLGQRLVSELFGELDAEAVEPAAPAAPAAARRGAPPELLRDPVLEAKYAALRREGTGGYLRAGWQPRLLRTPQAVLRDQLLRIHVEVERYLRTGAFLRDGVDLQAAQCTRPVGPPTACPQCDPEPCDCITDVQALMHERLNPHAISAAVSSVLSALLNDGQAFDVFRMSCFVLSEHETNACPDCGAPTRVLAAALLRTTGAWCDTCHAVRCTACASAAAAADPLRPCRRCVAEAR